MLKGHRGKMAYFKQKIIVEVRTNIFNAEGQALQIHLNIQNQKEKTFWKQKYRIQWLKEWEQNSKFFHYSIIQHRHNNKITSIKDDHDTTITKIRVWKKSSIITISTSSYNVDTIYKNPFNRSPITSQYYCSIPKMIASNDKSQ